MHHDELLPLAVVPVLALGDTGLADVDAHLPAVGGMHQLREAAARVYVHLERVLEFVGREVCEVEREQLFRERPIRHLRHQQRRGLRLEFLQEIDDLAQRDLVRRGHIAVAAVYLFDWVKAVILTALLLAFQQVEHALDEVIYIEQLQLRGTVVDGERLVVGHCPAEGGYSGIVLRAAMPHEVREAVDRHLHAVLFPIAKEQLLPRQLGFAIVALVVTPDERRLNR